MRVALPRTRRALRVYMCAALREEGDDGKGEGGGARCSSIFAGFFTDHGRSGQEVFYNLAGWVESDRTGRYSKPRVGRVGSVRVGTGRIGSGRVGSGRVGSGREVFKHHGSGRVAKFSSITCRVGLV